MFTLWQWLNIIKPTTVSHTHTPFKPSQCQTSITTAITTFSLKRRAYYRHFFTVFWDVRYKTSHEYETMLKIITALNVHHSHKIRYLRKLLNTLRSNKTTHYLQKRCECTESISAKHCQQWRISFVYTAHLYRREIRPVNYIQLSINLYNTLR